MWRNDDDDDDDSGSWWRFLPNPPLSYTHAQTISPLLNKNNNFPLWFRCIQEEEEEAKDLLIINFYIYLYKERVEGVQMVIAPVFSFFSFFLSLSIGQENEVSLYVYTVSQGVYTRTTRCRVHIHTRSERSSTSAATRTRTPVFRAQRKKLNY